MTKPRITTPVELEAYAELELRDILVQVDNIYSKSAGANRSLIAKEMKTNLQPYKKYLEEYFKLQNKSEQKNLEKKFRRFLIDMGGRLDPKTNKVDANVEVSLNIVYQAFNKLITGPNRINPIIKDAKGDYAGGDQQAHKEFTNIGAQSFLIYTHLNKINRLGKKLEVKTTDSSIKSGIEGTDLEDLTEYFRRLWITCTAIADMPKGMFAPGKSYISINNALNEYFTKTSQQQHIAKKVKQVDVLTGKGTQEISIEEQVESAKVELDLGRAAGDKKRFKTGRKTTQEIDRVFNLQRANFARLKGSNPLEGEIVKQLTDVAAGKKPKKYTSSTVKKKKTKFKNTSKQLTSQLKPLIIAAAATGKYTKLQKPKIGKKRQSEKGSLDQRQINKLKMKINQRLPAEVRRNMGRPALRNQTGRFSNSVTLTELRQGPKTLIGKYAYMFAPYETFENEGERRWPTGYNPKPLITKSIRNLALQYTEEKFTLRRE